MTRSATVAEAPDESQKRHTIAAKSRKRRKLLSPEVEATLAVGRRKGRKRLQTIINEAIKRGPKEVLAALNANLRTPSEIAAEGASSRSSHLAEEYARTILLQELQDLATRLISVRGGKTHSLQVYLADRLQFWATVSPRIWVQGADKPNALFSPIREEKVLSLIRRSLGPTLLRLWDAPADWLARLRSCQRRWCETPYFLDRSPASRAKYCSTSCRGAQHRKVDERRLQRLDAQHPTSSLELCAYFLVDQA